MTAVAPPSNFQSITRPGWSSSRGRSIHGLDGLNPDQVSRGFDARRILRHSQSASYCERLTKKNHDTFACCSDERSDGVELPNFQPQPASATSFQSPHPNSSKGSSQFHSHQSENGLSNSMQMSHTDETHPILLLHPLNGTFARKIICVPFYPNTLLIGRQTNQKTIPTHSNGFFDSKVLSRTHAEVWADRQGKIFIRDIKSSNGTFVNGARLSPEYKESQPIELKDNDVIELGIDIVSDDHKFLTHHKIAARVEHAGFYPHSSNRQVTPPQESENSSSTNAQSHNLIPINSQSRAGVNSCANSRTNVMYGGNAANLPFSIYRPHGSLNSITIDKISHKIRDEYKLAVQQSYNLQRTAQYIETVVCSRQARRRTKITCKSNPSAIRTPPERVDASILSKSTSPSLSGPTSEDSSSNSSDFPPRPPSPGRLLPSELNKSCTSVQNEGLESSGNPGHWKNLRYPEPDILSLDSDFDLAKPDNIERAISILENSEDSLVTPDECKKKIPRLDSVEVKACQEAISPSKPRNSHTDEREIASSREDIVDPPVESDESTLNSPGDVENNPHFQSPRDHLYEADFSRNQNPRSTDRIADLRSCPEISSQDLHIQSSTDLESLSMSRESPGELNDSPDELGDQMISPEDNNSQETSHDKISSPSSSSQEDLQEKIEFLREELSQARSCVEHATVLAQSAAEESSRHKQTIMELAALLRLSVDRPENDIWARISHNILNTVEQLGLEERKNGSQATPGAELLRVCDSTRRDAKNDGPMGNVTGLLGTKAPRLRRSRSSDYVLGQGVSSSSRGTIHDFSSAASRVLLKKDFKIVEASHSCLAGNSNALIHDGGDKNVDANSRRRSRVKVLNFAESRSAAPYVGVVGGILIGVGLIAWLNGIQKDR